MDALDWISLVIWSMWLCLFLGSFESFYGSTHYGYMQWKEENSWLGKWAWRFFLMGVLLVIIQWMRYR